MDNKNRRMGKKYIKLINIFLISTISCLVLFYLFYKNKIIIYSTLGNSSYQYKLGKYFYEKNELKLSKKWLEKSAQGGIPEANYYLGLIYFNEQIDATNEAMALKYFSEAGKGGIREGSYNAALILLFSRNIPKREDIAIPILEELVKTGYPKAARLLGIYYYYDDALPLNDKFDKAIYWFNKDISLSNTYTSSFAYLANMYSNKNYRNLSSEKSLEFKNKAMSPITNGEEIRTYDQWHMFAEMSKIK